MKLLRVEVEHFACICKAVVELGPGLNVLFGPNDIGKSTLAHAIRAVLLIQHTSSIANEFIEWDSDENPRVKLTLELPDRRFWLVEKRFGSPGGSSMLHESSDGEAFSPYMRGRAVDDEIRGKLGWGIAPPAGKGAPRGLPISFLSTVLLGEQTDVAGVLKQTLDADTDDSGRARLTGALAAFAQDPLFKSILEVAQGKVDLAFMAKGGRKRAKNSPFRESTDEVLRAKEELDQLVQRVAESENARREFTAANDELARRLEARQRAGDHLEGRRKSRAQAEARQSIEEELFVARQTLEEQETEIAQLRGRESKLAETTLLVEQAKRKHDSLTSEKAGLVAEEKVAQEMLRRAKSDEVNHARQLRQSEIEKREIELQTQLQALSTQRETATRGRDLYAELAKSTRRASELKAAREESEALAHTAEVSKREATSELALINVASCLMQQRGVQELIQALGKVHDDMLADRAAAQEHRARVREITGRIPDDLPDRLALDSMSMLARQLELAVASLGGGLAVVVELLHPVSIHGHADGAELEIASGDALSFEANRSFDLQIGNVAKILVTAGDRKARQHEAGLRKRWDTDVVPVLARTGTPDLKTLVARVEEVTALRAQVAEAASAAVRSEELADLRENQLANLPSLQDQLATGSRQLEGKPVDAAEALLKKLGATNLAAHQAEVERKETGARNAYDQAQERVRAIETESEVLAERLDGIRKGIDRLGLAEPKSGWDAYDAQLAERAGAIVREQRQLCDELASLVVEENAELEKAEWALADVCERASIVESKLAETSASLQSLREQTSRLEGEIETRRASAAKIDLPASNDRVNEISSRLEKLPIPAHAVTDEELREAELQVENAERDYDRANDDVRKAEGALRVVGGQVIFEKKEDANDAYRRAMRKEREVELEYDAWQLLVTKLREAENTEGRHLGEALSQPVTRRFAELTTDRYGKLEVARDLRATGLQVSGVLREIKALSVGSQEQLATVLRLTIAEQLGSTLVLDDHLTQTDPDRSAWFRDVLREHARKTQVIVLTCRPLDYLLKADMPSQDDVTATRAAGLVRAIDLSRIIERRGTASMRPK